MIKKQKSKKKIVLAVAGVLVLGGATAAALELTNTTNFLGQENTTTQETPAETIDQENQNQPDNTPSNSDGEDTDAIKDQAIKKQEETNTGSSSSKKQVTPVITSTSREGGVVYVRGYVSGIVENNGTCTFTFSNGYKKTSKGVANVSDTNCSVSFPSGNVPGTNWSVKLTYSSAKASGTSASVKY